MSVCCGATVTESPVCTPIGSTFSIEQTITTLSARSRITSSSNSPQPITDSSSSTWPIGEASMPRGDDPLEVLARARDAAAAPAEREGRAHDARQAELAAARRGASLDARGDRALGHAQAGLGHRLAEQLAVLGAGDRLVVGADQLDAEALQRAVVVQRLGQVQRGLAAERAEQRVGALALDHLRDRAGQQRLDVGRVGELRVGHDRRRVGVDEHDLVALLAQHLAGLHAGVVELGGLADHDRPGAEDQDLVDVGAPRHAQAASAIRSGSGRTGTAVVRAGAGLGVVLHGAAGHVEQLQALDGAVVEVDVRQRGGAEVGLPAHRLVGVDRARAARPERPRSRGSGR